MYNLRFNSFKTCNRLKMHNRYFTRNSIDRFTTIFKLLHMLLHIKFIEKNKSLKVHEINNKLSHTKIIYIFLPLQFINIDRCLNDANVTSIYWYCDLTALCRQFCMLCARIKSSKVIGIRRYRNFRAAISSRNH